MQNNVGVVLLHGCYAKLLRSENLTAVGKIYLFNDLLQVALFWVAAVWSLWVFILHWVFFPLFCVR